MPRTRHTLQFPSHRNLQIYHELVFNRRTQTALSASLHISQRRVSQIAQQVRAWVDRTILSRHFTGDDANRLHLAIAQERIRLQDAYEPLVASFTGPDGFPRYLRRYITVVNGQPLNTVEVSDKPNFHSSTRPSMSPPV